MSKQKPFSPHPKDSKHTSYIEVENIGPIQKAKIDLSKGFIILIGQNNLGKSYLAVLTKAIYDMLDPSAYPRIYPPLLRNPELREISEIERELRERRFRIDEDLTNRLSDASTKYLKLNCQRFLKQNLARYFGITEPKELINWDKEAASIHFENEWIELKINIPKRDEPEIELKVNQETIKENIKKIEKSEDLFLVFRFPLFGLLKIGISEAHYLPASRSGIMQSHRVVAASIVAEAPFLPVRGVTLPPLGVTMSQFIEKLLRIPTQGYPRGSVSLVADLLEKGVLKGRISVRQSEHPGNDIVYAVNDHELSLLQSASSVAELSPLILFLRYYVSKNSVLIIEEPEAHLHPQAIRVVAKALARLSNLGVKIMVTTHSDYLLSQVSNLVLSYESPKQELDKNNIDLQERVDPNKIAIYLFEGNEKGSKANELNVSKDGIPLDEFNKINDELYGEHISLFYAKGEKS